MVLVSLNIVDDPDNTELTVGAKSSDPMYVEIAAYVKLHPSLVENHLNHYVAIYQGKLIDSDANKFALYERIEDSYPDEFVLMRPVQNN